MAAPSIRTTAYVREGRKFRLVPDAELAQLCGDGAGPVVVRRGTGGTGMEDPAEARSRRRGSADDFARALEGELADADEPLRFQNPDDLAQVRVAPGKERGALMRWKFIGGAVPAGLFKKRERAIVRDEVVPEEIFGGAETFREQSPEPFPADFAPVAIESGDEPFRMLARRAIDLSFDAEPVADSGDLAERDAGLGHAERAGVHPEKQDAFGRVAVPPEINLVGAPSVTERVVNVRDRRREREVVDGVTETARGGEEWRGFTRHC